MSKVDEVRVSTFVFGNGSIPEILARVVNPVERVWSWSKGVGAQFEKQSGAGKVAFELFLRNIRANSNELEECLSEEEVFSTCS